MKNQKIRMGLIRCDTHGLWYGPLMAEHDPMALERPMPPVQHPKPTDSREQRQAFYEKQGYYHSWQSGGIHMYFYNEYGFPLKMTAPFVGGFEIVKLWDKHREVAEMASRVFFGKPKICSTFEEVSDDVDLVFIADCNEDGSDHLELARPGLEKGVPTFVDKPFADTVANCRTMIQLAKKKNTPIFSASILRFEPAFEQFRNRLSEIGDVNFATFSGYGTHPAGLVHTTSVTQLMFGTGISTVQMMTTPKQTAVWLDYDHNPRAPKHGVMIHTKMGERPHTALAASVFGSKTDIHTLVLGDYHYPWGTAEIIKIIQRMVETKKTPAELDDMVEAIAVIEAYKKAEATGKAVRVQEFLE